MKFLKNLSVITLATFLLPALSACQNLAQTTPPPQRQITPATTVTTPRAKLTPDTSPNNVTKQFCDANIPCPNDQECFVFQDEEKPICWKGDPCQKCPTKKCLVAESYPVQVFCQQ